MSVEVQPVMIEEWTSEHLRWSELTALIEGLGQHDWVAFQADWHLSSHLLIAHDNDNIVGFLYYVTQAIGVEEDQPAVTLGGKQLNEAKVIAFGVAPHVRRHGIGRRLQERLIRECRTKGCHQIRSHSSDSNAENHQLKLSLGFAMHPLVAENGKDGAYFLMPLNPTHIE